MSAGFAVAIMSGAPAMADDTELLLVTPDPAPKPNVLFIIDTSGSMDTLESTADPYDSAATYLGDCDTNALYWTNVDVQPVCSAGNVNYVMKSSFQCQSAANQLAGIGSYTNTMAQYRDGDRDGTGSGPERWQLLAPGYDDNLVECQADAGVHGDGRAGYLWATAGSNLADPFTNNPGNAVSWGSAPLNLSYTVYDGNYLNWKNSPVTVDLQRIDIVKDVMKKVLSSVNNLNVGLMRFNDNAGGPVIRAMSDLDANRQAVLDTIDSLPATGATPLSETLYESALYWRGMPAYYGETINETATDPNALASDPPEVYRQPSLDVCAKNYNVLLTDGNPNNDLETPNLVANLPNYATALGRTDCDGTGEGLCLDDVAEYLYVEDIDPIEPGDQGVTTHTIGFAINLPILLETAQDSGGQYFLADDVESLTQTLLSIIANINERSLSFSAPAVSVNTFNRTQNLNDLYITMFGARAKVHWPGNLKKYRLTDGIITDANDADAVDPATGFFADTSRSFWTAGVDDGNDVILGGAAQQLPDPAVRKLYTNNSGTNLTAATNQIAVANATSFADSDFGLTGATGEPSKTDIIRWALGEDVRDEDNDPATTVRNAMGDPLHSQPAAVVYGGTPAAPDIVVYTATNDGYLHAIDADTGEELWSFIPKELLSNFTRLYFDPNSKYKQYGIDGNVVPVVRDVNGNGIVDGADFVYILFGLRRGGNTFYALDVTNKNAPQLLWDVSLAEFGESWSTPVVTRIDIDTAGLNAEKAVVVIGGGYDTVHDTGEHPANPDAVGAGIHILDLMTGNRLWRAGPDIGADLALSSMTRAIPNRVRVIDFSGDGFADRMYAADLGGQILRFDILNGEQPDALVTGGVIAQIGAEGLGAPTAADTRRFYNSPDIAVFTDNVQQRRYVSINIGSGYRAHPFDLSAVDRFYSIRDKDVFNRLDQAAYDSYPIITEADLVEVSGDKGAVITSSDRGWKFTLPANQKILAESLTFDDEVLFVAFSPEANAAQTCAAGSGTNFLYRVSITNGDPIVPNLESLTPDQADDARRETLQQGGIAPSPTILFPSPDPSCTGDDCTPPPIGCVGVECFDPGFENNPVRTLWTQDGIQ
jgi:type IV pilus assembly protein PilY1